MRLSSCSALTRAPYPLTYLFDRQTFALVTDNRSAGAGAPVAQGRVDGASVSFTFNRASGSFTATAALTQFDADRVMAHLNDDQVPVRPARRGGPDGSAARGGSSRAPSAARGHERDPTRLSPSVRDGVYEDDGVSDDSLERRRRHVRWCQRLPWDAGRGRRRSDALRRRSRHAPWRRAPQRTAQHVQLLPRRAHQHDDQAMQPLGPLRGLRRDFVRSG